MPKVKYLKNPKTVIFFVVAILVVMLTAVVFKDRVRTAIDDRFVSSSAEPSLDEEEYKHIPRR